MYKFLETNVAGTDWRTEIALRDQISPQTFDLCYAKHQENLHAFGDVGLISPPLVLSYKTIAYYRK